MLFELPLLEDMAAGELVLPEPDDRPQQLLLRMFFSMTLGLTGMKPTNIRRVQLPEWWCVAACALSWL